MDYIKVKNWDKFQHYKERTPPWIKLHRDLLNNYEFLKLPDKTKGHLMMIWLLASQMDNKIPNDPQFIKMRIGAIDEVDIKTLIEKGFLEGDSNMLASCKQYAIAETETETETETERVCAVATQPQTNESKKNDNRGNRIEKHLAETGCETGCPDEWANWAMANFGWSIERVESTFERFADYWRGCSGQKGVKRDWPATWRNWCRSDNDRTKGASNTGGRMYSATAAAVSAVVAKRYGGGNGSGS